MQFSTLAPAGASLVRKHWNAWSLPCQPAWLRSLEKKQVKYVFDLETMPHSRASMPSRFHSSIVRTGNCGFPLKLYQAWHRFFFSKRSFKLLHGSLDSQHDMCSMPKVQKEPIPLTTSPTGLYLLNMMDICPLDETAFSHSDSSLCSSTLKSGVNLTSGVQVVRGNEVDGVNPFPSAAPKLSARPPTTRSFRSRDQPWVSSGFPVTRHSHANDGDHSRDHHRGHPASAHAATSDLCAPAGKGGECHRSGLRARCDDTKPVVGDDATDPGSKDSLGCPERRGDQSKAQSRTCGKIGKQGFRPFCLSRKRDEESAGAKPSFEPTSKSSTIITSQAASWQEIEEVEEIVVQESVTAIVQPMPTSRGGVPPAPTLPLPGNLTLAEWGTNVINFGRKHKGKTYASVMQQDPSYLQWSLARYGSLMPEHQDFVRYGQLWMKEVGNDLWGSKIFMMKCRPPEPC